MITIHCRLVAPEPIRRCLWHIMTERNTPLVSELLKRVSQHRDFETWQRKGTLPDSTIGELCEPLKQIYPGQPQRFYASATRMALDTYKAWLALQQKCYRQLNGKQQWLDVVKSDAALLELSGSTLSALQDRAQAVLSQLKAEEQTHPSSSVRLMTLLFAAYDTTDDTLSRCAIAHLIGHGCKIAEAEEDPEKFAHRIHRKQKEVERLEGQLQARLPKGRDLTGEDFLETLTIATQQLSESVAQAREWQAKLLTRPALLPYPIIYTSSDVRWGKTEKGRIAVNFNGIDKYIKAADPGIKDWFKVYPRHPYQLYCDQRQLPYFQRFLKDWQDYQADKDNYPTGLLTLSSVTLNWKAGEGKGNPWNIHHLALHCTFDTRLMTAEGTLQVQQEKQAEATKKVTREIPPHKLTDRKKKSQQRNASTLNRLNNLPDRPSQQIYHGNSEILVGLSVGLADPITVAVVNGRTGEVLTYRTARTLLGDRYRLLNRRRQQQQQNTLQRHKNQKRGVVYQPSESELGQTVDRLLAKAVLHLAQRYQAGSIVIPNLTRLGELLNSEITAKAERKCPGATQAQNQYAKQYRQAIHNWSYRRLTDAIRSEAQQLSIPVESGFQLSRGDPQEQARDIAIAAYHARGNTLS